VCEYYEDTSVCSTATQIASEIIDPATALPWDGERFIVVGCKRAVSQLTVRLTAFSDSCGSIFGSNDYDLIFCNFNFI
jgi:hypothetical protein